MITLKNISKKIGARILFDDVNVSFSEGFRYGLTGPNGCGKSTLLKILMKQEEASSGTMSMPKKVGFLKQNIEAFRNYRVVDTVIMGNERLWKAIEERDALYEQEMTDAVGMRLGALEEIVAEENGYTAESDAEILLVGMGLDPEFFYKPMHTIPLDRQFRVLLCQALFGSPEALLLDEPTNHLDLDSIHWLEDFLKEYTGTLVVVSHDRHFLNSITTHIADIDYDTVIIYPGNYDAMIAAKSEVRSRAEAENKTKEKKIAQLKEFVAKFGAGTRASQVQSRVREIGRLQPQELKQSNIQRPYIRFIPQDKAPGQIIFRIQGVKKSYDHPVIKGFSLEVMRGDKIGVIGANGRGKSTLLKMIAGALTPDFGKVELGHEVSLGYFPQNHSECVDKKNCGKMSVFDYLRSQRSDCADLEIRSVLGKLLFSGDDAFKEVPTLSGGETARLIIARLMLMNCNALILDEPNNHLDLEAVSALGWGLNEFKGTVICASHDRDLIESFAQKIISIEENKIVFFDGPLQEFMAVKKGS
ncbi:MAG: ABC-F family ATP-binding cassette domain-containing protein [Chlamydiae bacterium]|nr:ABC-F family ATP-binding cassette domain-containing protein [Chlamydiota bacterium]